MKKRTVRLMSKIMSAALLATTFVTGMTGCGGSGNSGNREVIKFWASVNQYTTAAMKQVVDAYNDGQGKLDGVTVQVDLTKSDASRDRKSVV